MTAPRIIEQTDEEMEAERAEHAEHLARVVEQDAADAPRRAAKKARAEAAAIEADRLAQQDAKGRG